MVDPQNLLRTILRALAAAISFLPALIYGYIYAKYFTETTYSYIAKRNKNRPQVKHVLDVGTATGQPLYSIIDNFSNAQVLGIDYNQHYVPTCRKLFEKHTNVEVRQMNYYDLEQECPQTQFDVIIFGSSFMILPDQTKALEIAKRKLNKNGRIYFLLTLYDEKTWWNRVMQRVKPILKYLSTVDFGKVTYFNDFQAFILGHGLQITMSERCLGNFFLNQVKFYVYEATKVREETF